MEKVAEAFKGKLEYAYHRTSELNIPSIVKNGFIPGYGDMYGKGWYMCYDLESQLNPLMTNYGDGVIKTQIFDKGVLIFDYNISKEMYGNKYTLVDQLIKNGIFNNESQIPLFYKEMSKACERSFSNAPASAEIAYHCFVRGATPAAYYSGRAKEYGWGEGNSCLNVKGVPRINKITAIVFSGNHDGNVVVGYSPNTVLPVAYAIINSSVCHDYKAGKIALSDIEFTPLKDYEIAEERARQARELYERLGVLRNSSIISLNLQYNKMTSTEFENKFKWIARDSKVTAAEITVDKDGKFIFTGGSWDNGVWQGDVFGDPNIKDFESQPKFRGGVFTKGEFIGDWEFGKFISGVFNGRWRGKGSKSNGGVWSAPPECWGSNAVLYRGATFMYETKPGSGKYVESDLTPPEFYKSLEGPQIDFSPDKKVLAKFDKNFTGVYEIPSTVEVIAFQAFMECKLKGVIMGSNVKEIGDEAFSDCDKLSKVQLGNGLKTIGNYAFRRCHSLNNVVLPTGIEKIGNYAFAATGISMMNFPDSVKTLGDMIFLNCSNLSYVKLPTTLQEVPTSMFNSCARLFKVDIPDNYTKIGDGAFYNCMKLRMIKFPSRLQVIGENAFGTTGLSEIKIPSSVIEISGLAFSSCNLKTVEMSPIDNIAPAAFAMSSIDTIVFNGTLAQWDVQRPKISLSYGIKIKCKDGEVTT